MIAPTIYRYQGAPAPDIKGSITAAMALACGATKALSPVKPYVLFKIIITPPTVAAETSVPRNFHVSCLAGVVPIQYPIFKSVIKPPAIDNAVHTTPPIINAATIPALPFNPTETSIKDDNLSLIHI